MGRKINSKANSRIKFFFDLLSFGKESKKAFLCNFLVATRKLREKYIGSFLAARQEMNRFTNFLVATRK